MSEIKNIIQEMCPDGVEYQPLWAITVWDKRFNDVPKERQTRTTNFIHVEAKKLKDLRADHGDIKLLSTGNFDGFTNVEASEPYINNAEVIAIPSGGTANIKYWSGKFVDSGNNLAISTDSHKYDLKYIFYYLTNIQNIIQGYYRGSGIQHPDMRAVLSIDIPVPPIEIQKAIVKVLDIFTEYGTELQAELQARIKQYQYYRDQLLSLDNLTARGGEVEWKTLGDIGNIRMCKRILKSQTQDHGVPFFKIGTFGKKEDAYISGELFNDYKRKYHYPKEGDVLISAAGTIGRTVIFDGKPAYFQDSNIVWLENNEEKVLNKYLYYFYQTEPWKVSTGGTIARIYNNNLATIQIPIPSLDTQERIIHILDTFDSACNSLQLGLPAEIAARQKQYEYYRNELLTFSRKS